MGQQGACALCLPTVLRHCGLAAAGVNREVWVSGLEPGLWVLEAEQGCKTHPEKANSTG